MLTALLLASALADPAPTPLAPIGNWRVDWGDTRCLAIRTFGDPADPVTLALRPSINEETIQLTLARKGARIDAAHVPVEVGAVRTAGLTFNPPDSKLAMTWINIDRAAFNRLAAAPMLTVRGKRLNLDLSATGLSAAIKAMDSCNADLRKLWNADAPGAARVAAPASTMIPLIRLINADDYPAQPATTPGAGRVTVVSLLINESGTQKDCFVERASGFATLDVQTCRLLATRASFRPARDAAGKAIKSRYTAQFRWMGD